MNEELPPTHWCPCTLGDLGVISGGSTPSTKNPEFWDGGIPWITPSEVSRCTTGIVRTTERTVSERGLANCSAKVLPPGTLLMTSRATIGAVAINAIPMATNQGFINTECDRSRVLADFLGYWITRHRGLLESLGTGATFRELPKSRFKAIPIHLPPLPEQRAIAQALRAVEEAREACRRELELERERKAALMEHLFTYGTRGEPTKQTEIGEMPGSWEIVRLGDACDVTTGTTPPTDRPEYYVGEIPFVKTSEIAGGRITTTSTSISAMAVSDCRLKVYPPGTVFLAMYGQGKTRGQSAIIDVAAATTQNTAAIRAGEGLNGEFLWRWLSGQYSRLRETGSLGHISHLNLGYVKGLKCPRPPLTDQRAIAEILNAVDDKADSLERETALLNELFHATLEELMTGKLSAVPLIDPEETP